MINIIYLILIAAISICQTNKRELTKNKEYSLLADSSNVDIHKEKSEIEQIIDSAAFEMINDSLINSTSIAI